MLGKKKQVLRYILPDRRGSCSKGFDPSLKACSCLGIKDAFIFPTWYCSIDEKMFPRNGSGNSWTAFDKNVFHASLNSSRKVAWTIRLMFWIQRLGACLCSLTGLTTSSSRMKKQRMTRSTPMLTTKIRTWQNIQVGGVANRSRTSEPFYPASLNHVLLEKIREIQLKEIYSTIERPCSKCLPSIKPGWRNW